MSGPRETVPPWIDGELVARRERDLYRSRREPCERNGCRLRVGDRTLINFSSNDYLGLAGDNRLADAAHAAMRQFGCGAGASPLISGYLPPLQQLERTLAEWEGEHAALVFSSGFAANVALISALVGPDDAIFSDSLNHASLIDGCRLARAKVHIYPHCDINYLDSGLRTVVARRRLIVTDSLFSMDGDIAPLADLAELADRHDAWIVLDEAHATGVLGHRGRGLTDLISDSHPGRERIIKVSTLSKSVGSQGGFVCGPRRLIDWLVNVARPYVFSTALVVPAAAAAECAIQVMSQEPQRRERVFKIANYLRSALADQGFRCGSSESQIVPILIGASRRAVEFSGQLEERGFLVPAIRPPSVPEGTARLRISVTAGHTDVMIDDLVNACAEVRRLFAEEPKS